MTPTLVLIALVAVSPHTDDPGEALYLSGVDHRAAGQLDQALARLTEVVAEHPDSPFAAAALLECGRIEEQRGGAGAARGHYDRLLEFYPSHRLAREATTRIGALDRLAAVDDVTTSYRAILGNVEPGTGADAVARVEELVADHPDHPVVAEAECWLASQARQVGRWDDARDHVDRAIAADADHDCILRSLYDVGYDALNHGQYDRAEEAFGAMADHGEFGRQGAEYNLPLVQQARHDRTVKRLLRGGLSVLAVVGVVTLATRFRRRRKAADA